MRIELQEALVFFNPQSEIRIPQSKGDLMPPQSDPNDATVIHDPSTAPVNQTTIRARDNLIGITLGGRYLIEQALARGGMGAVYLARDKPEVLARRVVIRELIEAFWKC